jgi:MFS family permease
LVADWHLWLPPALTKRRFRLYSVGHAISVTGGWVQQVALAWLVFRLTNSIFLLGLTGFLLNIFYLLLGPVTGLAADRLPRLQTLIAIDVVLAFLSIGLAAMALTGVQDVAAYLAVAALIGIASAFEMPIRQTMLKDIVGERALLASAIGVGALVFNVGRMIGPAIAGVLLAFISEAWCFVINAVSFVAIIGALVAMRLPPQTAAPTPVAGAQRRGFWANFGVLMSFPVVRYLVPTVAAIGLCATAYMPLMPSIVAHFFDGQSSTVGMLMSAAGVGALVSAAYLSLQPGYGRTIRLVTAAPLAVGVVLMAFAWSRLLPLSLLLTAGLGASVLVAVNATNALLQQSVPDEWRGRAMGLYSMAFAGTAPVGNIVTGSLAERIGLAATLTLNGALIVVAGLLARWRLHNHPEALLGMMRSLSR